MDLLGDDVPVHVECGCHHSIILTSKGNIITFGRAKFGECANGNFRTVQEQPTHIKTKLKRTKDGKEDYIVSCSSFHYVNLFLSKYGRVYCSGNNGCYATGIDTNNRNISQLTHVNAFKEKVTHVYTGGSHSFFYTENRLIYSCGSNFFGELCLMDYENRKNPTLVQVDFAKKLHKISLGFNHTLLLTKTGKLYSAGRNLSGELGHGDLRKRKRAELVKFKKKIVKCFSGHFHNFVIADDESVWAWGSNEYGEQGHGDYRSRNKPTKIFYFFEKKIKILKIECGLNYTFFLSRKNVLYACGKNDKFQLCLLNNDTNDPLLMGKIKKISVPTKISTFNYKISSFSCGQAHNLFLMTNSLIFSNGSNEYYNLGVKNMKINSNKFVPIDVQWNEIYKLNQYYENINSRNDINTFIHNNNEKINHKKFVEYKNKTELIIKDLYERIENSHRNNNEILNVLKKKNNNNEKKNTQKIQVIDHIKMTNVNMSEIFKTQKSNEKILFDLKKMETKINESLCMLKEEQENIQEQKDHFLKEQIKVRKEITEMKRNEMSNFENKIQNVFENVNSLHQKRKEDQRKINSLLKVIETSRTSRNEIQNDINNIKERLKKLDNNFNNIIDNSLMKINEENKAYQSGTLMKIIYKKFAKKREKEEEKFLISLKEIKDEKILFLNQLITIEKEEFALRLRQLNKDKEELTKSFPKIVLKKVMKRVRKYIKSEIKNELLKQEEECDKLMMFLSRLKLDKYYEAFKKEEIIYEDLKFINENDLKEIFKDKHIHKKRFLNAIETELMHISIIEDDNSILKDDNSILKDIIEPLLINNNENVKDNSNPK